MSGVSTSAPAGIRRSGTATSAGAAAAAASPAGVGTSNSARTDTSTPRAPQPLHQRHSQQRMPAQSEEIILSAPTRPTPSTSAKRLAHEFPSRTVAGPRPLCQQPNAASYSLRAVPSGRPSRSPSTAPCPAPPQPTAPCTPATATAANTRTAPARPACAVSHTACRDDVGDQPLIPGACPPGRSPRGFGPRPGHAAHHGLHLAGLDPESPDLDLVISPTRELQLALHPTTGPHPPSKVHPRPAAAAERARHEPLWPSARTLPPVPPRQARARHIQLPRHTGRHRAQPLIQHKRPHTRNPPADHAASCRRAGRVAASTGR